MKMTGDVDKDIKIHFEDVIRELAMQRAMLMKLGIMSEEEITEFLNVKGEEYAKKYESMNPVQIMLDRLEDIKEEMVNGK